MKIYVYAFAESRKDIAKALSSKVDVVVEHIIKVILMPNHTAKSHWKTEIAENLKQVRKLSGSNKYPKASDIYMWTYDKCQDQVTDPKWMKIVLRDISDAYNVSFECADVDEICAIVDEICAIVDDVCVKYFKWLSEVLSQEGRAANSDIYAKLDELIK